MNLSLHIAKKYLFSKKKHHVINIISWVSVVGIAVATLALIVVLSAFNGLQALVEDLYASFDPDIKITALKGKTFETNTLPIEELEAIEGVVYVVKSIEDVALFKHEEKQTVATLKGVETSFYDMTGLDSLVYEGSFKTDTENANFLCLGYGIANNLSIYVNNNALKNVSVIVPKRGNKKSFLPTDEFKRQFALPSGVFSVSPDFDSKYVLSSLNFAQQMFDRKGKISSIELGLTEDVDLNKIKNAVKTIVGKDFEVKTRYELNELIFKTNETEKWITLLILSFILVIASFNIIGCLTMLIIDKKEDIWILKTMGANNVLIRKIFFTEGMLINCLGGLSGMLLGAFICWLQMTFGLLKLDGGVVEFYPIKLEMIDFVYVSAIIMIIGVLASWYPARILTKKHF